MSAPAIFLVEDDPMDVRLFKRAILKASTDTDIQVANDGQCAIDELITADLQAHQLPKLIILDIKLPKILGFDVLRALRATPKFKGIPVVMMSSSTQRSDIELSYELGANGYISKPSTFAKLTELVSHMTGFWLKYNAVAI